MLTKNNDSFCYSIKLDDFHTSFVTIITSKLQYNYRSIFDEISNDLFYSHDHIFHVLI